MVSNDCRSLCLVVFSATARVIFSCPFLLLSLLGHFFPMNFSRNIPALNSVMEPGENLWWLSHTVSDATLSQLCTNKTKGSKETR